MRRPGELQTDILELLDDGSVLAVADLARFLQGTNEGAVLQALRRLEGAGRVAAHGSRPMRWRALTAGAAAPAAPVVPIVRPNGDRYHPRTIAGRLDVDVLRELRAADIPVLLYGPPGTGKTALIEAAFGDVVTVAGDADTTVADLVGEYTQDPGGGFRFVYGPLVTAMREGRALLVDDASLIPPGVLAALYPAMDGRRQISVKAHTGETVTAAPGFYVAAGHNPGVHGAVLTEALASRFSVHIEVTTDYGLAAALGVSTVIIRIAQNLATRRDNGEVSWSPQMREMLAASRVADLFGMANALGNLVSCAPAEDRATVASVAAAVAGFSVTALSIGPRAATRPTP